MFSVLLCIYVHCIQTRYTCIQAVKLSSDSMAMIGSVELARTAEFQKSGQTTSKCGHWLNFQCSDTLYWIVTHNDVLYHTKQLILTISYIHMCHKHTHEPPRKSEITRLGNKHYAQYIWFLCMHLTMKRMFLN